ncbi:MAG TPA: carbon storage regulator [Gemmataceae bacterium]|jgi:carbon storage regulator CsrA|nr:carbon storage regulator [Gemmataceae bacterium]
MLVLSRKLKESIVVSMPGGTEPVLKVTVVEFKSGQVRLGFEAHTDILINRSEVWERILASDLPESPVPVA